jgi:hypothetical protein
VDVAPPDHWPADERTQFDETLAAVRAALDQGAVEAAMDCGRAMTRDEAVAYARR